MEEIDTFLMIAGGVGSRLWPMSLNKMKASLPIGGKTIAGHMLDFFTNYIHANNIVFSISEQYKGRENELLIKNKNVQYLYEKEYLGTGGGFIRHINENRDIENVLIANVDLILSEDLKKFFTFHKETNALCTIFSVEVENPSSYGLLRINSNRSIFSFKEKDANFNENGNEFHSINGGLYFFSKEAIQILQTRYSETHHSLSMEYDLLPWLIKQYSNRVYAYPASPDSYWLDLGSRTNFIKGSYELLAGDIKEYKKEENYNFLFNNNGSIIELEENPTLEIKKYIKKIQIYHSIISSGSRVGIGSKIIDSIICKNVEVPTHSQIKSSIVGEKTNFLNKSINLNSIGISGKNVFIRHFN